MKARILVISAYNPFTPQPGGAPRWLRNRLESLAMCADVTLVTFADRAQRKEIVDRLRVSAVFAPPPLRRQAGESALVRGCRIFLGRLTLLANIKDMVQALEPYVSALIARERFDLIQVDDIVLAPLVRCLPQGTCRLLVFHNLLTAYLATIARARRPFHRKLFAAIECGWVRRFERQMLNSFSATVVLTRSEHERAHRIALRARIHAIPLEIDLNLFPVRPVPRESPSVAFSGTMSYPPNEEAALYFLACILPRIRQRIPAVQTYIVGRNPSQRIQACASTGVTVTGEVDDVSDYLLRADVIVVPLLTGGGMRVKILEAWVLSRPVVSTSLGADGLEYEQNKHLLIADDAAQFADKVCGLIENPAWAHEVARNGRRLVEERYSKEHVWKLWENLYGELLGANFSSHPRISSATSE